MQIILGNMLAVRGLEKAYAKRMSGSAGTFKQRDSVFECGGRDARPKPASATPLS
jgi:hypothetical protein